jgi:NFU1 iron-sulfur cluster scaffold homolog, mitochondrial
MLNIPTSKPSSPFHGTFSETMAAKTSMRSLGRALTRPKVPSSIPISQRLATSQTARCYSDLSRATPLSSSSRRLRPSISEQSQSVVRPTPPAARTIFIQTEDTPNADALKFRPNHEILPDNFPSSFLEYLSPRSTLAPPHPSPLAAQLMNVDGVTSVFYGKDYITVTKDSSTPWAHVKPEVFSIISEAVTSGQPIVNTIENKTGEQGQGSSAGEDAASYNPEDEEVVGMIQELLETRIRPAIQEDGGDIEFRGFHDGQVLLKLRGACRTCDSSTVTLKNGIESMLMHYIEEVKGVQQVMDQEEEVAMKEFAKFEEKLKAQGRGTPTTVGKGSLDTVEA